MELETPLSSSHKAPPALKSFCRLAGWAWEDPQRGRRSIALSLAVFLLLLGEVAAAGRYSVVQKNLITALQAKNAKVFHRGLWHVGRIILCISPIIALREYAAGMLSMLCRTSLTSRLARRYLMPQTPCTSVSSGKAESPSCPYYTLTLTGEIDNPDQRICQDVSSCVSASVSFAQDLVRTCLSIATFAPVLYAISPRACLGGMIYAVSGTLLAARGFGTWLGFYQMKSVQHEADLRYKLIRVRENAESIAFFEGGAAEWSKFDGAFGELLRTMYKSVLLTTGYSMVNRTFHWATFAVIPMLVGPAYLEGKIEFGVISQATMAFNIILEALTLAMHRLDSLSDLAVRLRRLEQLEDALVDRRSEGIHGSELLGSLLRFKQVTLRTPTHRDVLPKVLFEKLSFEVSEGQSLLVSGESGIGKSSLLRAAAGLWKDGAGTIELCGRSSVFFMPQKPYMFLGSLKDQLLYPHVAHEIPETAIRDALRRVRLEDLLEEHGLWDAWTEAESRIGTNLEIFGNLTINGGLGKYGRCLELLS
eukprot:s1408_g6.t1